MSMLQKNRKKIAFFANSVLTYGGEQRVISILANQLVKNYEVSIFTEDILPATQMPFLLDEKIQLIHFKAFKASPFIKVLRGILTIPLLAALKRFPSVWKLTHYNTKIIKRFKEKIEKENYDVIIAVSDFLSVLAGFAKKTGIKSKVIVWEHNSFEAYFRTPGICLWQQDLLFNEMIKYVDHCVVLNEDYAKKYETHFGIKCDVIYNPRSFVSEEKSSLKNNFFLTCCRLKTVTKGLDLLLDAFEIFSQENKTWILQIAGDGMDRKNLELTVRKRGLEKRIQFLGYRNDIKKLLLHSSVFLLSSRWEGFPMTLTEAYECGVPVVAFDIPAVLPFKNHGGIVTAKPFDVQEFAEKMKQIADSYDMRIKMAQSAIKFSQSLSIENFIEKWNKLLF